MATNNRYQSGMELLKKAAKVPGQVAQSTGAALSKIGSVVPTVKKRYSDFNKSYNAGKLPTYAGFNPFKDY